MRILGLDYGRKKVGIALGDTKVGLAEPLEVMRGEHQEVFVAKVQKVVDAEQVEQVIVGLSEGEMGKEIELFVLKLRNLLKIPVFTHDETLSSIDAQSFSIEAGIQRKKRKNMEDAYAAAIMLQDYLNTSHE